jgi:hypothetical protein
MHLAASSTLVAVKRIAVEPVNKVKILSVVVFINAHIFNARKFCSPYHIGIKYSKLHFKFPAKLKNVPETRLYKTEF